MKKRHYLEVAVDRLAQLIKQEEHAADLAVWAVVALAAALDVEVIVVDEEVHQAPGPGSQAPVR